MQSFVNTADDIADVFKVLDLLLSSQHITAMQWHNILTGGPWTNYIKGPVPHFEFTEEFITIKVLTKITIKHKTMMKCEVKSNFIIKAKLSV